MTIAVGVGIAGVLVALLGLTLTLLGVDRVRVRLRLRPPPPYETRNLDTAPLRDDLITASCLRDAEISGLVPTWVGEHQVRSREAQGCAILRLSTREAIHCLRPKKESLVLMTKGTPSPTKRRSQSPAAWVWASHRGVMRVVGIGATVVGVLGLAQARDVALVLSPPIAIEVSDPPPPGNELGVLFKVTNEGPYSIQGIEFTCVIHRLQMGELEVERVESTLVKGDANRLASGQSHTSTCELADGPGVHLFGFDERPEVNHANISVGITFQPTLFSLPIPWRRAVVTQRFKGERTAAGFRWREFASHD